MSTSAIETLKQEESQQVEKLKALSEKHRDVIAAGNRASRELEAQKRHVDELQDAIAMLQKAHLDGQKGIEVVLGV